MKKWYCLFSHTGQEITNIMSRTGLTPEAVLSTNLDYSGPLKKLMPIKTNSSVDIEEWLQANVKPRSIITLNGYMRLVSKELLDYLESIHCEVYNLHPAPIQLYPELVGKDPQERLCDGVRSGKYQFIGNVIHSVDAGLDSGFIVAYNTTSVKSHITLSEVYQQLHDSATDLWVSFFRAMEVGK